MNNNNSIKAFVERWTGKGYEKGQSQIFWTELLMNVLGVQTPSEVISFEDQVKLDHTAFIDAYIEKTHVMIEQKSISKELTEPIKQSDGTLLKPFQQAKRYASELPYSQRPRWIITCNFRSFYIYDMEKPQGEPFIILLENLEKEAHMLQFIVKDDNVMLQHEMEVSIQAGEMVGKIYEAFLRQFGGIETAEDLHALNVLCVRLVFCLYAEDAGVFGKDQFYHYMKSFSMENMRIALRDLFQVLDTPLSQRDRFLEPKLAAFPYVNGSLFRQRPGELIPSFSQEVVDCLLDKASIGFDWSDISPTIFGAVFESTLNPETRRSGGMHYTSIENIHKVIDPLFMDALNEEFEVISSLPAGKQRAKALVAFQDKLASLKFFDPACGSDNFLTETYISLRRLENKVIREQTYGMGFIGFECNNPIKVRIHQFYGIEINDFAVTVATAALWIAEAQMMAETEEIIRFNNDYLPLKNYTNIHEGNALRIAWEDVVNPQELNYIMGNPPFVGYKYLTENQKEDILSIIPQARSIDYVSGWFYKALRLIKGHNIKAALVSTNSITQGSAIQNVWKGLIDEGIVINFAWTTFKWESESTHQAAVHCVIIGFSNKEDEKKYIFTSGAKKTVKNINPYLVEAENIIVERSGHSLCNAPVMTKGAQLIDGGGFMLNSDEEKMSFLCKYPEAEPYIYKYYNAQQFINSLPQRYCLYLKNCPPNLLRNCKGIYEKVKAVYNYRINSEAKTTRALAETPSLFFQSQVPTETSIVIPVVSSENRRYIPMGFMPNHIVYANTLLYVDKASIYHFGVLTSNVHMAWTRLLCGRMKSDYRYSNDIVYNNFPWPTPTAEQQAKIEQTAQAILDARALYPDSSLADLYDEVTMPPELRRAHQNNDRAVMAAYGFPVKGFTESDCVAELLKMYQQISNK